jgi:hypothetical protein
MKGSRADRTRKENTGPTPFSNEKNWIGGDFARDPPPAHTTTHTPATLPRNDWIEKKEEPRELKPQGETRITTGRESGVSRGVAIGNKSPVELMQDILKGARQGEEVRSYYSQ